jgi:hypothetical protein
MKIASLLILAALTGAGALRAEELPAIAVMELSAPGLSSSDATGLSNRLVFELMQTGRFTVLERSKMDDILKEQGFQKTGCTNTDCAVEMGQLLNVKYMVLGNVDIVGRIYSVNLRLVSVSTAQIENNKTADCSQCTIEDVMLRTIGIAARKIAGTATAADTAAPTAVPSAAQPRPANGTRTVTVTQLSTGKVVHTETTSEAESTPEAETPSAGERAIRPANSVEPPAFTGRRSAAAPRKQTAEPTRQEQLDAARKLRERKTFSLAFGMSTMGSNTFHWWEQDSFNIKYSNIKWGPGIHADIDISPIREYSNPNSHSFFGGCDLGVSYDQNSTVPSTVQKFDSLLPATTNIGFTSRSLALRRISIFDNICLGYSSNTKPVGIEPYTGIGGTFDFTMLSGSVVNNKTFLAPCIRIDVPFGARIYIRKFFFGFEYDLFFASILLDNNLDYDAVTKKSIDGTLSYDHVSYWVFSIGGVF